MKQQTSPNKDIQKEIADMTEVNGMFGLERRSEANKKKIVKKLQIALW